MASWLKVAEDLLEVVDRKAKLVANELSDEQSGSQDSVKSRQLRFKGKGQPRKTIGRIGKSTETEQKQPLQEEFNLKVDKIDDSRYEVTSNHKSEAFSEVIYDARKDQGISNVAYSGVAETIGVDNDINGPTMIPTTENNDEISCSTASDTASVANFEVVPEMTSSFSKDKGSEDADMIQLTNINPKGSAVVVDTSVNETTHKHDNVVDQETEKTFIPEVFPNANGQAQGLLKAAVSTGNSKESRLAKVCAGLSSRLQECKSENAQLEELLSAERELNSSYEVRIKQLHQDLSALKAVVERAETNMDEVLTAKNSEIESLVATVDNLKKQLCTSEEKNVSLQVNMETVTRSRELTENRMIQALREELAIAERRAEEERVAHNATKMAAVEREIELEHRAVEASNALSSIQRKADESTSRVAELEHKVALLDVECASLTQELQELESRNRRGQKKASEETSQILQVQAWQEEVERSRHCQRDAENKLSLVEAELQKMRVVMAGMKRDAEHYSRQEHMELEKRYRELTDLLYHKQTQLEAMASEKAAAFMQLEKEIKRLQETQVEAEKSGTSRRSSVLWEEDADIKAIETLPLHHRNMATASRQLQRAAKLLDSGAVRATRFLWRYPTARVSLLIYLVFVHLFLMYLLHRLQAQAEDFSSREVAASMGLGNSSLP